MLSKNGTGMKQSLVWKSGELPVHTEYEREGKNKTGEGREYEEHQQIKSRTGCEQTFGLCALFVDGLLQGAAEDFVTLSTKGGPFTPYIRRVDGVLP